MRNYRARGVTKDSKPIFSEQHEHLIVAGWLDAKKIFYCHVPNGEWRHPATARKLKAMGVKPGCPDFLIFDPPTRVLEFNFHGVALELKALDSPSPNKAQLDFANRLNLVGWMVTWERGADAAIKWLEGLGY